MSATGRFTYYQDWTGFNIPSCILKPFRDGAFAPLSGREKRLLKLTQNMEEPFYLIGVHRQAEDWYSLLVHEAAHGFFHTDEVYRNDVLTILSEHNTSRLRERLRKSAGYHEAVLDDEVHAYIISMGHRYPSSITHGLNERMVVRFQRQLLSTAAAFPAL